MARPAPTAGLFDRLFAPRAESFHRSGRANVSYDTSAPPPRTPARHPASRRPSRYWRRVRATPGVPSGTPAPSGASPAGRWLCGGGPRASNSGWLLGRVLSGGDNRLLRTFVDLPRRRTATAIPVNDLVAMPAGFADEQQARTRIQRFNHYTPGSACLESRRCRWASMNPNPHIG